MTESGQGLEPWAAELEAQGGNESIATMAISNIRFGKFRDGVNFTIALHGPSLRSEVLYDAMMYSGAKEAGRGGLPAHADIEAGAIQGRAAGGCAVDTAPEQGRAGTVAERQPERAQGTGEEAGMSHNYRLGHTIRTLVLRYRPCGHEALGRAL